MPKNLRRWADAPWRNLFFHPEDGVGKSADRNVNHRKMAALMKGPHYRLRRQRRLPEIHLGAGRPSVPPAVLQPDGFRRGGDSRWTINCCKSCWPFKSAPESRWKFPVVGVSMNPTLYEGDSITVKGRRNMKSGIFWSLPINTMNCWFTGSWRKGTACISARGQRFFAWRMCPMSGLSVR